MLRRLTDREIAVLQHVARGYTDREIGDELGISRHTVRVHTQTILRKWQVHNRARAVALGICHGVISPC